MTARFSLKSRIHAVTDRAYKSLFLLRDVAGAARHSVFVIAPSGVHAVRGALEDGFDLVDLAFFDLEHFRKLPCPWVDRPARHGAPIRCFECAVGAQSMVEECETEDEAAFPVDRNISAIADPPDKVN